MHRGAEAPRRRDREIVEGDHLERRPLRRGDRPADLARSIAARSSAGNSGALPGCTPIATTSRSARRQAWRTTSSARWSRGRRSRRRGPCGHVRGLVARGASRQGVCARAEQQCRPDEKPRHLSCCRSSARRPRRRPLPPALAQTPAEHGGARGLRGPARRGGAGRRRGDPADSRQPAPTRTPATATAARPLHVAAFAGPRDAARALLAAGADPGSSRPPALRRRDDRGRARRPGDGAALLDAARARSSSPAAMTARH